MALPTPFGYLFSEGFPALLYQLNISLELSTYQAGKLVLNSRQEELAHPWSDIQKEGVLISDYFNPREELAKQSQFLFQTEVFYW